MVCSLQLLICTPVEIYGINNTTFKDTDGATMYDSTTVSSTESITYGDFKALSSASHEEGTTKYTAVMTESFDALNDSVDQMSGFISKEQYESLKHIIWIYLIPAISLSGMFGNSLGVCFLFYRHRRQSFLLLLLALITMDLMYLTTLLIQSSFEIMRQYNMEAALRVKCQNSWNLLVVQWMAFSTCTHLITLMAYERLTHIVRPFWARKTTFMKQTIAVIIFMFISNVLLRIPAFLSVESKEVIDLQTNITRCMFLDTEWRKENNAGYAHFVVAMLVITQFVPLGGTIVANAAIIISLARHRVRRAMLFSNGAQGEQNQQLITTITLIILSAFLTLSLVPNITMRALVTYQPMVYGPNGPELYTEKFISEITFLLRSCSATADFVVYILMSKSSRTLMISFFRRKFCSCLDEEKPERDVRSRYTFRSSATENTDQTEIF